MKLKSFVDDWGSFFLGGILIVIGFGVLFVVAKALFFWMVVLVILSFVFE